MGKMSRDKGAAFERETVNLFKEHSLKSRRTALSGALAHEKNDVLVTPGWNETKVLTGECRRRAKLPAIFREIEGADFLTVREDRGESYTIIPTKFFAELLQ